MPVDERLRDTAQNILDNLASALTAAGLDVPDRRYIHSGDIAHDFAGAKCVEAFIVTWDGLFQGLPGPAIGTLATQAIRCSMPLTGQFTVALLRCVPTLNAAGVAPSASALQTSGEQILTDAMTLPAVTIDTHLAGNLLTSPDELVGISRAVPVGPLGAVGGVTMTLVVSLA